MQPNPNVYPLLKLIIPLALTGLVQSAVWFFETIFLAHLSPETLAAGSLVSWAFGTVVVILFGTLSSINILVAHKHGAHDEQGILLVVRDGKTYLHAMAWGILPNVIMIALLEVIMGLGRARLI